MGLSRNLSILYAIVLTALTALAFQNCAGPDQGIQINKIKAQGGGSGDPYEGGNRPARNCEAPINSFGLQSLIFQDYTKPEGQYFNVTLVRDNQAEPLSDDAVLTQNETTAVDWPIGQIGRITSYTPAFPDQISVAIISNGDSTPTSFVFTCR